MLGMATRQPFAIDEWYHCYNRGVDKRVVFSDKSDYERLLLLMFTANSTLPSHTFHLRNKTLLKILSDNDFERGDSLIEIGAYSLMPNHFHFLLKEVREGGIALFMQKVFTGYTMYFNRKNGRTGSLFAGTFKSKRVSTDDYLKQLVPYIHLNGAEMIDSKWKTGRVDEVAVERLLKRYPYSSLPDFLDIVRPHRKILGNSIFELFDRNPTAMEMLRDAKAYYAAMNTEVK